MHLIRVNRKFSRQALSLLCITLTMFCIAGVRAQSNTEETTAVDPTLASGEQPWVVPVDVLSLQIKHLSIDELIEKANLWQEILRKTVLQLNEANVEIWYENQKIEAAKATASDSSPTEQASADRTVERESQHKDKVLTRLADLRERRVQVIDRLNVVLDELSTKLGQTEDGKEHETVQQYRRYVNAVKGLKLDVADTHSTSAAILAWFKSSEGGVRLAKHLGQFLSIVAGFWLLSIVLGKLVDKAMTLSSSASQILRKFATDSVRRITIVIGLLLGLAALEVNVTPMVAVIGAAGFVIAFALQNTLSNFASGLMIMFYKPFDIGDFVETSQVAGKVNSMTLVTTNMMTVDNKLMVVPNNELWGKVITNVTGSSERRVDLVFGIGYDDDIAMAERVLAEVVAAHPLVLKEPEPVIRVAELADSSVNLICRPWVKTPDYWPVYWELTKSVKERFDAEGISIPFPQRDVHVHTPAQPGPGKQTSQS
jgi:small conductance mechanosensitive channel